MNLIELSNNLKDVPDQLLLKEIQEPTGAYPSYLVITEMTRRKRMRESAVKEAPETTVAEDLTQPSREQMMRAMAQMQGQAQPMIQPPQSLNAGLMAAAQPDELAAMDAAALAKKKAALAAAAKSGMKVPSGKKREPGTIQVDPRESDGTFNQPKAGTPVAKKPSPAKGMPY